MKKFFSILAALSVGFISFNTTVLQAETGTATLTITPGVLAIANFPATLDFQDYTIGVSDANLILKAPFEIVIDDFTGSYNGWSLNMTVANLTAGADNLQSPSLMSNFTSSTINDSDGAGAEIGADVSAPGTFTKTDGVVTFATGKKIISAQAGNSEATSRHFFNFAADSLQLAFENTTKAGAYSGATTFALVASP
jgi:hypothetical protein